MPSVCLVTGGAGFIGCALTRRIVDSFDRVIAFDNLHPQIHPTKERPVALPEAVELFVGDVANPADWDRLLAEVKPTVIVHLAAETGTGQSLTEASRHATVNVLGTTQMTDALVRAGAQVEKIVLVSSRAVYGEGKWADAAGNAVYPGMRTHEMLQAGEWDFPGLTPLPQYAADTQPHPANVYAATKLAQENLLQAWCGSFGVELVRYRLQNAYGKGQSLINSYAGIVGLFARWARVGKTIPVYEDGNIVRDFVYIDDVADAIAAGALRGRTNPVPYDIGMGQKTTIMQVAQVIAARYGAPEPVINGQFRDGDVRAAWANIEHSTRELGWTPRVSVEEGIGRLCEWIDECETGGGLD